MNGRCGALISSQRFEYAARLAVSIIVLEEKRAVVVLSLVLGQHQSDLGTVLSGGRKNSLVLVTNGADAHRKKNFVQIRPLIDLFVGDKRRSIYD